jgi:hypothetical protein
MACAYGHGPPPWAYIPHGSLRAICTVSTRGAILGQRVVAVRSSAAQNPLLTRRLGAAFAEQWRACRRQPSSEAPHAGQRLTVPASQSPPGAAASGARRKARLGFW